MSERETIVAALKRANIIWWTEYDTIEDTMKRTFVSRNKKAPLTDEEKEMIIAYYKAKNVKTKLEFREAK